MFNGYSIRKIAAELEIAVTTAFYWRHKILDALKEIELPKLKGIVEADEAFFRLSYKGQKKGLPRPPRKRGNQAGKRGLSKEQVCVLTAIDRNRNGYMKPVCLGPLKVRVLALPVSPDTVLVTDKQRAYPRFCQEHRLDHKVIHGFRTKQGPYHLNTVNSLHSQLKRFMYRFNGVATKYLDNYLTFYQ